MARILFGVIPEIAAVPAPRGEEEKNATGIIANAAKNPFGMSGNIQHVTKRPAIR